VGNSRELEAAEDAFKRGDLPRAERLLKRVLAAAPLNSRANELLAYTIARRGDEREASEYLQKATASANASATAWYYMGVSLRGRGELVEAKQAFRRAIAIDPHLFPAHHDLGVVLFTLGEIDASLQALNTAATLDERSSEVFHNRGRTLHALRLYEEALDSYGHAIRINPDEAATFFNRGEVYNDLKRYAEALADYGRALELRPGYDDVRWNEALTRLTLGQFETGWQQYESRWKGDMARPRRHADIPAWSAGSPVAGKRILVWWEQGLGDTLQFCRYLPLLRERGAEIVFEVQPALKRLASSLGDFTVVASGDPVPACDSQIPLLSLPLAFRTTLESIPARVPYLNADPENVRRWRNRLKPGAEKLNIGVACAGHASQKDDKVRSMRLANLAPLAQSANLFVIQVEVSAEDREFAAQSAGRIRLLDGEIRDFDDSAAIAENMDLVVTIDTSVAHLAGALAKPTWILLPWTPTWRWMVDREDSPWYPTARLFRQSRLGDWDGVVARVREELESFR
jgi:tetratricopeptide (TPR) repeat protein